MKFELIWPDLSLHTSLCHSELISDRSSNVLAGWKHHPSDNIYLPQFYILPKLSSKSARTRCQNFLQGDKSVKGFSNCICSYSCTITCVNHIEIVGCFESLVSTGWRSGPDSWDHSGHMNKTAGSMWDGQSKWLSQHQYSSSLHMPHYMHNYEEMQHSFM